MTELEHKFLEAYYKACNSSQPYDWMKAAMRAKQMYNDTRHGHCASEEEKKIMSEAGQND